ncbi:MAG TPA: hypothetical protein IGS17_13110 [Oscillatoriales cyanobacterium M59_W2019_021]|nr:hypothetical protein [Oscillatoriales cyanobacterium M4454_W2019_049]HIK51843.1 hypothetical protein [Oscillatoriales cyanobacterium M59_W2019_021]
MKSPVLVASIILLFSVGLISRIAPLFNVGGRLLQQWPTEDGYLMLTIARNIALGNGMSTAAGTIPTNGTQPLFNLIEAVGFAAVGGDKTLGVAIALVLQIIMSLVAARFLFLLARRVLCDRPYHREIAALTSGLWYSSSVAIPHTMNCLETGLYVTLVLISVYVWYGKEIGCDHLRFSAKSAIGIGILLGLTFWARIDAVFLIAAITSWHTLLGLWENRQQFFRRIVESTIMGLTSIVVASPWLINNYVNFGSLMPISGTAQSATASFGQNVLELPSKLFEYASIVLPIPQVLERALPVLLVTSLVVLIYAAISIFAAFKMTHNERILLYVTATFGACLVGYYGLLFGAAHFVSRYTFPISPFLAILTVTMVVLGWERWSGLIGIRQLLSLGTLSLLVLALMLNLRLYREGTTHPHFQVVRWIEENASEETWVGAVQTGTLGFFHDRTVNLDGKVNPNALAAKLERKIPEYVATQTFDDRGGKIDYLADWIGIASWMKYPPISQNFEVVVEDRQANLAVLRRKFL